MYLSQAATCIQIMLKSSEAQKHISHFSLSLFPYQSTKTQQHFTPRIKFKENLCFILSL